MYKLIFSIVLLVLMQYPVFSAEITLGAGVGLKDVLNDISAAYIAKNPDVKINKNYAASGVLAKQIGGGAEIDVFISANLEWLDYLKEKKLIDGESIFIFAYNFLVFAGRSVHNVNSMNDIVKLRKIAIGSPKSVPAGEYAMQSIKSAGMEKVLEGRLVMARDVRECLMYAERGEVDGAFIYKTDAMIASDNVKVIFAVPQELYPRVTFPAALTTQGTKKTEAVLFFEFLKSQKAKDILIKYGFEIK